MADEEDAGERHGETYLAYSASRIKNGTRTPTEDILALEEALVRLGAQNSALANAVKLRYFAGMSVPETAAVLEIPPGSVD
ncbi:MAG TPA: ECF-type sigma factor [Verrucomicrobiales bacterium]|nr:ECF-type sigma factor [Verrucomicrobiales bacterium]